MSLLPILGGSNTPLALSPTFGEGKAVAGFGSQSWWDSRAGLPNVVETAWGTFARQKAASYTAQQSGKDTIHPSLWSPPAYITASIGSAASANIQHEWYRPQRAQEVLEKLAKRHEWQLKALGWLKDGQKQFGETPKAGSEREGAWIEGFRTMVEAANNAAIFGNDPQTYIRSVGIPPIEQYWSGLLAVQKHLHATYETLASRWASANLRIELERGKNEQPSLWTFWNRATYGVRVLFGGLSHPDSKSITARLNDIAKSLQWHLLYLGVQAADLVTDVVDPIVEGAKKTAKSAWEKVTDFLKTPVIVLGLVAVGGVVLYVVMQSGVRQ